MARINCLHCETPLRIRSSRKVVPTSIQLGLQCTNVDCGATFGGVMEITHGISPSALPNPGVQLRMVTPKRRLPEPANDDGAFGASAPGVAPLTGSAAEPPRAANDDDVAEAVQTGS